MSEEQKIGRFTHVPLEGINPKSLDARHSDIEMFPTRRISGYKPQRLLGKTRSIYQRGREQGDPNVLIEQSHIDIGFTDQNPYFVYGESWLKKWVNPARSEMYDYEITLGFSMDQKTRDFIQDIRSRADGDDLETFDEFVLSAYECKVTPEEVTIFDRIANDQRFILEFGGYDINSAEEPLPNVGWSGYPPQRLELSTNGVGGSYEFSTSAISIPFEMALSHGLGVGPVIPQDVTIVRGVRFQQANYQPLSSVVRTLIDSGLHDDYTLRKIVDPFIDFVPGNLLEVE